MAVELEGNLDVLVAWAIKVKKQRKATNVATKQKNEKTKPIIKLPINGVVPLESQRAMQASHKPKPIEVLINLPSSLPSYTQKYFARARGEPGSRLTCPLIAFAAW